MKRTVALVLLAAMLLCGCSMKSPQWQEEYNTGIRYLDAGDYEEAIICFSAAIEIDPRNPDAYVLRGDAYALAAYEYAVAGDFVTVREYLQRARQDYNAAASLGAEETYDLDGRHQELDDFQAQAHAQYQKQQEQTAPTETTEATEPQPLIVAVEDAYSTSRYHIPRFVMEDDLALEANKRIYTACDAAINTRSSVALLDMRYLWGQTENLASVIVRFGYDYDLDGYETYTISKITGQEVNRDTLLAEFGYDEASFRDRVREVVERYYANTYGRNTGDIYYTQRSKTLNQDNIAAAQPYIDNMGELCVAIRVYGFAGADSYMRLICITGSDYSAMKP